MTKNIFFVVNICYFNFLIIHIYIFLFIAQNLTKLEMERTVNSLIKKYQKCIESGGSHFNIFIFNLNCNKYYYCVLNVSSKIFSLIKVKIFGKKHVLKNT